MAVHLEMFATTQSLELAQGTTRVVPCRELAPNNIMICSRLYASLEDRYNNGGIFIQCYDSKQKMSILI